MRIAHYGSAAGELALCVRAVGIADRRDLEVLEIGASPDHLDDLVERHCASALLPGGVVRVGAAWWCRVSAGLVLVVATSPVAGRLAERLRGEACRSALFTLDDAPDWAVLGIVGRQTPALLSALGVYGEHGDPRRTPPLTHGFTGGAGLLWLLESDRSALALAPKASVGQVWEAIAGAGRPLGVGCVGREALDRFALLERRSRALAGAG